MSSKDLKLQALKVALEELRSKTSYEEGASLNVGQIFKRRKIPLNKVIPIILPKLGIIERLTGRLIIWSYSDKITLELCEKIMMESRKYLRDKVRDTRKKLVVMEEPIKSIFLPGDLVYTYESDRPYRVLSLEPNTVVLGFADDSQDEPVMFMSENVASKILSFKPYTLVDGGLCQKREIDYNSFQSKLCIFYDTGTLGFIDRYARFGSGDTYPHKSCNNVVGTENVTPLSEEDSKIIENIFNKYHV